MENLEFKTIESAKDYLKQIGKTKKRFYRNIYGWETYLTLKPTTATPTGKLRNFPRTKLIFI